MSRFDKNECRTRPARSICERQGRGKKKKCIKGDPLSRLRGTPGGKGEQDNLEDKCSPKKKKKKDATVKAKGTTHP